MSLSGETYPSQLLSFLSTTLPFPSTHVHGRTHTTHTLSYLHPFCIKQGMLSLICSKIENICYSPNGHMLSQKRELGTLTLSHYVDICLALG